MMRRQFLLVVFAFIFLSTTLVNAIKCKDGYLYGPRIEKNSDNDWEWAKAMECEDACVYFKCIGPRRMVYEAFGCYATFERYCDYISTEIKNNVVKNIKSFEYYDNTVMVATCSDKDFCEQDAFNTMKNKDDKKAVKVFGSTFYNATFDKSQANNDRGFRYQRESATSKQRFADNVTCSVQGWCETGKNYNYTYQGTELTPQGSKVCDACVFYRCTVDGSQIMSGYGCYEDFDKICQVVPSEVKKSIQNNINASLHRAENYVVVTCRNKDECAPEEYRIFMDVNPTANITKIDKSSPADTCEFEVAKDPNSPDHRSSSAGQHAPGGSTASLEINVLMMLFGIFFASFACII